MDVRKRNVLRALALTAPAILFLEHFDATVYCVNVTRLALSKHYPNSNRFFESLEGNNCVFQCISLRTQRAYEITYQDDYYFLIPQCFVYIWEHGCIGQGHRINKQQK